jgi:hypothetical protein
VRSSAGRVRLGTLTSQDRLATMTLVCLPILLLIASRWALSHQWPVAFVGATVCVGIVLGLLWLSRELFSRFGYRELGTLGS